MLQDSALAKEFLAYVSVEFDGSLDNEKSAAVEFLLKALRKRDMGKVCCTINVML